MPERDRAVITAQAPGREVTEIPSSWHLLTNTSPGSEIAGVPASVMSAMFFPCRSLSISSSAFSKRLYSW